jgi:PHD/YefM family antitoxin component YafN of YafNO toxin-antitoxin module
VTTIPANDVRIPMAAREALARHEEVMVSSHGRPVFVIVNADDYERASRPATPTGRRGRPLREALAILANAPFPDPDFADDMEAVRASVGSTPADPWEHS